MRRDGGTPSPTATRALAFLAAALVAVAAWPRCCAGQDFAVPGMAGPASSPLAYLESGLPPERSGFGLDAAVARWYGLPELATRAVALGAGRRALRAALGVSQSGDAEIGWSAAGLALGAAVPGGGAALRLEARRDRWAGDVASPLGPGVGVEAGGGAWIGAGGGVTLWASAPQAWRRGLAPPLARPLEIGGGIAGAGGFAWIERAAPPGAVGGEAECRAGVGLAARSWALWLEARDHPLRGGLGLSARSAAIAIAAAVAEHPVLGETVRLAVGIGER